jgi:hypothetical protein
VHAAGLLKPLLPGADVQGVAPSGVEATPGVYVPTPSLMLHAAPGPDAGHCSAPAGTLTLASSAGGVALHPSLVSPTMSGSDAQAAAIARSRIRLDGGAAASAGTLK